METIVQRLRAGEALNDEAAEALDRAETAVMKAVREAAARDERLQSLHDSLAGLVGWAQMILMQEDMPPALRSRFADNHRLTTAVIELAAWPSVR